MNRLRQLLLRLYPAEWRARYGDELAALVEDVPPSWSSNLDLLKGALKMQFSIPAFPKLAVMLSMAGLVTGLAVSFTVPARYTSSGLLKYEDRGVDDKDGGERHSPTDRFMAARSVILSQAVLSSVMMVRGSIFIAGSAKRCLLRVSSKPCAAISMSASLLQAAASPRSAFLLPAPTCGRRRPWRMF